MENAQEKGRLKQTKIKDMKNKMQEISLDDMKNVQRLNLIKRVIRYKEPPSLYTTISCKARVDHKWKKDPMIVKAKTNHISRNIITSRNLSKFECGVYSNSSQRKATSPMSESQPFFLQLNRNETFLKRKETLREAIENAVSEEDVRETSI